jgi:cytochrome c oxidase assembly protein subunit 11
MEKPDLHRKIYLIGGIAAVIMFGFCFAMVPLYNMLCKATGINTSIAGSALVTAAKANEISKHVDLSREVTVQFTTTNHKGMPWEFFPNMKSVKVHPGETTKVTFHVNNPTDRDMVSQAIPSMTPGEAVAHFHKLQCFCFNSQPLKAHMQEDMVMVFQIDKDLPQEVHVITLAYTLFDVTPVTKKG